MACVVMNSGVMESFPSVAPDRAVMQLLRQPVQDFRWGFYLQMQRHTPVAPTDKFCQLVDFSQRFLPRKQNKEFLLINNVIKNNFFTKCLLLGWIHYAHVHYNNNIITIQCKYNNQLYATEHPLNLCLPGKDLLART